MILNLKNSGTLQLDVASVSSVHVLICNALRFSVVYTNDRPLKKSLKRIYLLVEANQLIRNWFFERNTQIRGKKKMNPGRGFEIYKNFTQLHTIMYLFFPFFHIFSILWVLVF